jgi:hypothetical protein
MPNGHHPGATSTSRRSAVRRLGITEDFNDSIFNVNVKGLLFTVQQALPLMPDGAAVILNASLGDFLHNQRAAVLKALLLWQTTFTAESLELYNDSFTLNHQVLL